MRVIWILAVSWVVVFGTSLGVHAGGGSDLFLLHEPEAQKVSPFNQPKRRSFWCWIRRHRMHVAGFNYFLTDAARDRRLPEAVMVCQCKLNDAAIPTFVDQLRRTECLQ